MPGRKSGKNYRYDITLPPKINDELRVIMEIEQEDDHAAPSIKRAIDFYYKKYSHAKRNEIRKQLGLPLDEK